MPLTAGAQTAEYANYQQLTQRLEKAVQGHRDMASLQSVATTRGGKKVWLVQIAGQGGMPVDQRPALFVAANLEGDQLIGSALTVEVIEKLLADYGQDPAVKALLDSSTLYLVPRMNPDAAENMFAKVNSGRRTNDTPYDDDNDGRVDEDGPEDLNGDGLITLMRVTDPNGAYIVDPDDTRLMRRADPVKGERGTHTLYWEGIDNDGDGFINEDPVGGVDLNRSFQHNYPYYTRDAGRYMVGESEARGVMDFLLEHRNVAAMLVFGASDNLIVGPNKKGEVVPAREIDLHNFAEMANEPVLKRASPPAPPKPAADSGKPPQPGARRVPQAPVMNIANSDLPYFSKVSDKYRELTGIKVPPAVRAPRGALFEYGYFQYGVPSFSTPGWGLSEPAEPAKPTAAAALEAIKTQAPENSLPAAIDKQMAQWFDSQKIEGFVPWTAIKHPTLKGTVEVGGFKPLQTFNPPASTVATLAPSHAAFVRYLLESLPRVAVSSVEVKAHGGGLYRIKAEIENTGVFPSTLAQGALARSVKPTLVQIEVAPERVVAGAAKTSFIPVLEGSGRRASFEWIVQGRRGEKVQLKVQAQKGGTRIETVTLP